MANLFSHKKVYKVNPDCDFPHVCLSKIKRPVEVKGTVIKKTKFMESSHGRRVGQKYYGDWW